MSSSPRASWNVCRSHGRKSSCSPLAAWPSSHPHAGLRCQGVATQGTERFLWLQTFLQEFRAKDAFAGQLHWLLWHLQAHRALEIAQEVAFALTSALLWRRHLAPRSAARASEKRKPKGRGFQGGISWALTTWLQKRKICPFSEQVGTEGTVTLWPYSQGSFRQHSSSWCSSTFLPVVLRWREGWCLSLL